MNNPSPLLPQGSLTEQKNKGRARVKIAVFFVLAVHGIGLLALLMQGCRREEPGTGLPDPGTNTVAAETFDPTSAAAADTNVVGMTSETNTGPQVPVAPVTPMTSPTHTPVTPVAPVTPTAPPADTGTTEYKIVKGDTFATLAPKFRVTTKAIEAANPGVNPTKLQIGQTIQIPAPVAAPATAPAETAAGAMQTYKVKSGDNLTTIATRFKTTAKAIRAANGLKTDTIRVGQTLKIPVKTPPTPPTFGNAPATAPATTEAVPTNPATGALPQ